jgi:hypothetical protein
MFPVPSGILRLGREARRAGSAGFPHEVLQDAAAVILSWGG